MGLLVRNPLAFPTGVPWGFDPTHIAAPTLWTPNLFSGVASGANFINLLTGAKGTPTSAARVGDALGNSATASLIAFPNSTTCPTAMTLAGIVRPTTLNSNPVASTSSNGTGGLLVLINQTTNVLSINFNGSGGFASTLPALVAGVPYFVACSVDVSNTASYKLNFLIVRLDTGQIFTQAATSSLGAMGTLTATQSGNLSVGGSSNFGTTRYFAGMQSPVYLTINELLKWADDPWGFWYPRRKTGVGVVSAISVPLPGAGMSSGAGSFGIEVDDNQPLPGAAMTSAPGLIGVSQGKTLPGVGVTSAPGSFSKALVSVLAGAGVTSAPGSFADAIARALTGASAAFSGGTLTVPPQISIVQSANASYNFSTPSFNASFTNPIAAGSFIVVMGMFDRTATSATMTTDKGDTATDSPSGLVDNATVGVRTFCRAFFNPTAGAQTVTITPNVSVNPADLFIWEIKGIPNPIFDKVQTGSDATTAPSTPSTGTLSTPFEAATAYAVSTGAMTGQGSGWNLDGITSVTASLGESRVTSATTAIAGTGVQAGSSTCQIWVATFMSGGVPVSISGAGLTSAAGTFAEALSKALAGAGVTAAPGALGTSQNLNVGLTGAAATAAAGALVEAIAKVLAGAGLASAAGSFSIGSLANVALSGAGAAIAAGTIGKTVLIGIPGIGIVSAAAGADITELVLASATTGMTLAAGSFPFGSTNLTGAGATITAGALVKALQDALAGAGATITAGALAKALQDALAGAGATITAGAIGVSAGGNVNLSGAGATAAAGTLANIIAVALAGAGLASGAGSFVEVLAKALAGAGLASGAGTFAVSAGNSTSLTLTGAGMTSAAGSLANAIALAVVGAALTSGAGVIVPLSSVVVPLSGAGMASAAGTIGVAITRALAGVGIVSGAGTLIPLSGLVVPLSGAGVTSGAGTIARAVAAALSGVGLTSGVGTLGVTGEVKTAALTGVSATISAGVLTVTISGVTLPVPAERTVAVPFELRVVFAVPSNRAVR